ncbi:hypothetical protein AAZX31_02G010600 [Glycine max]
MFKDNSNSSYSTLGIFCKSLQEKPKQGLFCRLRTGGKIMFIGCQKHLKTSPFVWQV